MNKRAGSFAEYAILLGIFLIALTSMSTYLKRGIQARLKDTADGVLLSDLTGQNIYTSSLPAHQYVAIQSESAFTNTVNSTLNEQVAGNTITRDMNQVTDKAGGELSVSEGFEDLLP